ncbi:MAG: OmpH family outer membrane protein [Bacteroidales bacterium]|jgi:outer membrane protein|nr:OmpH family outer membrane protein [Bacteroidales bacterium]MDI3545182.1 outer membrane protein [Rikenellaceae bacterium]
MKKFSLIIVLILFVSFTMAGQQTKLKIGHLNTNDLMQVMPGVDSAGQALNDYAQNLQKQLETMVSEFQTKYDEYLTNEAQYVDAVKQIKQKELVDLQTRIQDFQNDAQDLLAKKEQELMQPFIDKAKNAIDEVAKEKGYTYILDTSTGSVLYWEGGDDIMMFVKEKLGIK